MPYYYGCFSFQADADLNALLQKGLLESTREEGWTITQKAKPYLPKETLRSLGLFLSRTVPERGRKSSASRLSRRPALRNPQSNPQKHLPG